MVSLIFLRSVYKFSRVKYLRKVAVSHKYFPIPRNLIVSNGTPQKKGRKSPTEHRRILQPNTENIRSTIRLASLSIISASGTSLHSHINYRRCRPDLAKQFSPETARLAAPIEAYRSRVSNIRYPAIFRNGYSIFTMVDKRTDRLAAEKKSPTRSPAYEVLQIFYG